MVIMTMTQNQYFSLCQIDAETPGIFQYHSFLTGIEKNTAVTDFYPCGKPVYTFQPFSCFVVYKKGNAAKAN